MNEKSKVTWSILNSFVECGVIYVPCTYNYNFATQILLRGIKTKQSLPLSCTDYFSTCLPNAPKKKVLYWIPN